MTRVPGWQRLLSEYLIAAQDRYVREGFSWGGFDCVHFVSDWVLACTGEDPLSQYRGAYSTEDEARQIIASEGSLHDALVQRFGEPVHPSKARRGDIAYCPDIEAMGIFFTSGARLNALFLGEGGFAIHSHRAVTHAFHV